MNETLFGKGALPHIVDERDYQFLGKSSVPFDWSTTFDIEKIIGVIPSKNQGSSYSCGGQAWSYYNAVLKAANLGEPYTERSAKYIYAQTFVLGGGSDGRKNSDICKSQGVSSETLCVSYENGGTPSELFMERPQDITFAAKENAASNKEMFYGNVTTDIETIAQAVRDNYGCVLGVYGENNGTWLSSIPKSGGKVWAHWLYAGKVKMENGVKYIGVKNSWGDVGDNGWQWLSEEFFKKGNIFVGWIMTFDKSKLYIPPEVKNVVKNESQIWIINFLNNLKRFMPSLFIGKQTMENTTTGSYVAIASLIVAALSYFNIVIPANTVVTIIAGLVTLYGVIKQLIDHKTVVAQARAAGVPLK